MKMDTNNKSKFFTILVVGLLLLNTSVVVFLLVKRDKHHPPPHPQQQGGAFNFLVKELSFDSAQIKQYQGLRNNHKQTMDSIRNEMRVVKDSLFNLLKTNNSSDVIVQQKLNCIAQSERCIDEITFNHFKRVRAICNVAQQTKFDEVIATAMKMNAPQHQSPPPRDGKPPRDEEPEGMPRDEHRPPPPER